jgi:hydroxymethylglutaryl-CoA lyase
MSFDRGGRASMQRIVLHEVGPRDGLQVEKTVVPTGQKEAWIRGLLAAGIDRVQAGSFVHPEKVPQMADSDALIRGLVDSGVAPGRLSGLVLNEKGLDRALASGVGMVCMGVSASDTHSRKNTGMGTDEATVRIVQAARKAVEAGREVQVSVQSAFGCGFEGPVPAERVLSIVRAYTEAGLTHISLADTAGHAWPEQVERLYAAVAKAAPEADLACHFHDTYGTGMANVYAALRTGVTSFDSSFAGLGGCPFTKVAAGNVATEDLVHAFQREGRRTDIDLAQLIVVARSVAAFFGREMPGRVQKTGPVASKPAPVEAGR